MRMITRRTDAVAASLTSIHTSVKRARQKGIASPADSLELRCSLWARQLASSPPTTKALGPPLPTTCYSLRNPHHRLDLAGHSAPCREVGIRRRAREQASSRTILVWTRAGATSCGMRPLHFTSRCSTKRAIQHSML